jgi:selenocysteine lyase/cysteine desulfurase
MSPLLTTTKEVVIRGLGLKMRPYTISEEDFFTGSMHLRNVFSKLIANPDPQRIAIIPSVSYGIENAARNIPLRSGDEILVVKDQFPSNIYPWEEIAAEKNARIITVAPSPTTLNRSKEWNEKIIDQIHIRTKVVTLPQVHWSEGILFDLPAIRQKTEDVGAFLIIDGTQSVGAYPFSIEQIQPDALICACYKWLLGPYSLGLGYYGPKFDEGKPIENSWMNRYASENFSGLVNYQSRFKPQAERYNVGEQSNFLLLPIASHGISQILKWGPENIQDYLSSIVSPLDTLLDDGYELATSDQRGNHLIGIKLPAGSHPLEIKQRLDSNQIYASLRGDYLRISPYLFNEQKEIQKLVEVLLG